MTLPSVLALLVIALVPVLWYLAWWLWRKHRESPNFAIQVAAVTTTTKAAVVTVFAGVFLNNGMQHPILDSFATMVLTRLAILALVGPALYQLWVYRK